MKTLTNFAAVAGIVALSSTAALAGGQTDPLFEEQPIVQAEPVSSLGSFGGAGAALLGLVVVAGVVAAAGGSTSGH